MEPKQLGSEEDISSLTYVHHCLKDLASGSSHIPLDIAFFVFSYFCLYIPSTLCLTPLSILAWLTTGDISIFLIAFVERTQPDNSQCWDRRVLQNSFLSDILTWSEDRHSKVWQTQTLNIHFLCGQRLPWNAVDAVQNKTTILALSSFIWSLSSPLLLFLFLLCLPTLTFSLHLLSLPLFLVTSHLHISRSFHVIYEATFSMWV